MERTTRSFQLPVAAVVPLLRTVNVAWLWARVWVEPTGASWLITRSGTSMSETSRGAAPLLKPAALAVITIGWVPSLTSSLTPLIVNVAVSCPAAMVIEAGTTASLVSLEVRLTVSAEEVAVLRRTVAVAVPVSAITPRSRLSVRLALSSSSTCKLVLAEPLGSTTELLL